MSRYPTFVELEIKKQDEEHVKTRMLIVGGIVLGALIVGVGVYFGKAKRVHVLPGKIGNMLSTSELRGEKAREVVNQMHGKDVTPEENIVHIYKSESGQAVVYLSIYGSPGEANKTYTKMVELIKKEENGAFKHYRDLVVEGKQVSMCLGLGQAHFFFLVSDELYWLSTDMSIASETINHLLKELSDKNPDLSRKISGLDSSQGDVPPDQRMYLGFQSFAQGRTCV
jgi:hypothetical protein